MIDIEFINRAKEFVKNNPDKCPDGDKIYQRKKRLDNPSIHRNFQKKYRQSEKGKIASLKRMRTRKIRERNEFNKLSKEEKKKVREFYRNKPYGYQVDHIVPLCLGGTYDVSNLQYLTPEQNQKKGKNLL